jgi:hypothetical protein
MRLFAPLALAIALAAAAPAARATPDEGEVPPPIHAAAWVNGGPYDIGKMEGKVVAILFFSLESPELDTYFAKLNRIAKEYAPIGLVFIGVTRDAKNRMEDNKAKAEFAIACDDETKTWKEWAIRSYPWGFVLNIYGEVSWAGEGFEVGSFVPAIELALKDIKGITVKRDETGPKFEKVWKAVDKADFKTAIKLLQPLSTNDNEADSKPAQQMLKDIGVLADQRLARADELAKRREYGTGERILKAIQRTFEGLPQAKAAKDLLEKWLKDPVARNEIEAMNAFLAAKAMEDGHDQTHAVERYQDICNNVKWNGTKGRARAQERLEDIKAKRKKKPNSP